MSENQNPFDDTSKKVAELLDEVEDDESISDGKFSQILEELGITKSTFFKFVILVVLVFFGFNYFSSSGSVNQNVSSEPVDSNQEVELSFFDKIFGAKDLNNSNPVDNSVVDLVPSNNIGVTPGLAVRNLTTYTVSNRIGLDRDVVLSLESYLLSYKKMKTIYDIDLRLYLDSKTNRVVAFEDYITEYQNAFILLKNNIIKLEQEIIGYKTKLSDVTKLTDSLESTFLDNVDNLQPYQIDSILSDYKEANLRKTALTNELKSREIVFDRIANRNDIIESQYNAIILNKDALIKGVTITNVEGSNINFSQ